MPDSLDALEQLRAAILSRIFRSGGFSQRVHYFCQWPLWETQCRCHQPNQPGHGPNFRLTRKVHGKTVTETFASLSALRKAQREIEGFHRFRELSRELLDVNERICHARPVEATLTAQEKSGRSDSGRDHARSSHAAQPHLC